MARAIPVTALLQDATAPTPKRATIMAFIGPVKSAMTMAYTAQARPAMTMVYTLAASRVMTSAPTKSP